MDLDESRLSFIGVLPAATSFFGLGRADENRAIGNGDENLIEIINGKNNLQYL